MKEFFRKMLNAKDPEVSSARFLSIITVLTTLYVWAFVSIWTRTVADLPMGIIYFVGIVVTGKTVEKFSINQGGNENVGIPAQP